MSAAGYSFVGTLSAIALALAAGAASADDNTITIEQSGTGNTLSVDQSRASGSSVGGLSLTGGTDFSDGNDLDLAEMPDPAGYETTTSARQTGSGNEADVTISGTGGQAFLFQDNQNGLASGGNNASIGLTGDYSSAAIGQLGLGNAAMLNVSGDDSSGAILQDGDDNVARLDVTGLGAQGFISQNGNNNDSGLVSVYGNGASVSYTQQGNGLSPVNANGGGVSVISNGAAVTITQTTFGSQ